MNAFEGLAALGYANTLPIIPPDAAISDKSSLYKRVGTPQDGRGKTPGVKRQDGTWSSFDWVPYTPDARDYARWHAMGAGVGIKTGAGLYAIDADTMDAQCAEIIAREVSASFGALPIRTGRAPKALYLIRVEGVLPYTRIDFGQRDARGVPERVEVLGEGRQFVAQGIHPKTGRPYTWNAPIPPFADLPGTTPQSIMAFLERLRAALPEASPLKQSGADGDYDQSALQGDPALLRKAVEATPNDARFDTRESYLDMGYAIRAAFPDPNEGFEVFSDWCERWADGHNDPDVIKADWARMKPPYRRGAHWLYDQAEALGGGKFSSAEVWFQPIPDNDNPFAAAPASAGAASPRRFEFTDFEDAARFDTAEEATPLIKGLLDQGAMSVLYGDSNVGKTFVAMDMAYHIATGRPYGGMRVTAGLVAYIAAEGGRGARKRLAALKEKFPNEDARPQFKLLASPVDLLRADADTRPLAEALRGLGPVALVVIDTLSRAMAGGDENSSVDMGALVKHMDAIRAATGAHLMVVHHSGKDKAKGARGHSLLRAATDTEIEVADGRVSATKQRDLDKSWSSGFELAVHALGADADGDPITSCTVRLVAVAEGAQAARDADSLALLAEPTGKEAAVLDALEALGSGAAGRGVTVAELTGLLSAGGAALEAEVIRFHLRGLERKGRAVRPKRGFWAVKPVSEAEKAEEMVSSVSFGGGSSVSPPEENGGETEYGIFS